MQTEWSAWLKGLTAFKETQGFLWIGCVGFALLLWKKGRLYREPLWISSVVLGILVLCPVTAMVLLKVYSPFYNWLDLQGVFPMTLFAAMLGVEIFEYIKIKKVPGLSTGTLTRMALAAGSVVVLFCVATNFHGLDKHPEADSHGVPVETAVVLESLQGYVGEKSIVLAAPSEILLYTRLYNAEWKPFYGRDLWSGKAASYINSGYTIQYRFYEYLEKAELTAEESIDFVCLIQEAYPDCIIVPAYWEDQLGKVEGYGYCFLTDAYKAMIKEELLSQ